MKLFNCDNCGNTLYFENEACQRCGSRVGYSAAKNAMLAVTPDGSGWRAASISNELFRFCANWELKACNWLVSTETGDTAFCDACRHNRTIPDGTDPTRLALWSRIETAKRRLIYSILRLELPHPVHGSGDPEPLIFDFVDDVATAKATTGHSRGVITIALDEASDAHREAMRERLNEPYRTLLGHFRHEVGHYYWDKLVRDGGHLDAFRTLFGDERGDYAAAMQRYYSEGPALDWSEAHITAYASMHPWEDFAETFAHYLHIVDTLEMAAAFGIRVAPTVDTLPAAEMAPPQASAAIPAAADLIDSWLPLVFAVNSLNRCMGQPDLYPFVVTPPVRTKLEFVNALVMRRETATSSDGIRRSHSKLE